jgi:RNA polymerase sigma factor (sigma-70 family)
VAVLIDGVIIQSELVTWLPWIQLQAVKVAMKCERADKPTSIEDMKQEGVIALLGSLQRFECDKRAKLYAFAKRHVVGAMYDYMRAKNHSRVKTPPLLISIDSDDPPSDYVKRSYNESKSLLYDLDHMLFPKKQRQRDIINRVVETGHQHEVGNAFGITDSRVSQIMRSFRELNAAML